MNSLSDYESKNEESKSDRIKRKFKNFLNKRRVKNNLKVTHTKMSRPYGKFCIEGDDETKLFAYIQKLIKYNIKYCLIEKHLEYSPIVIDLDFKYFSKELKRHYTSEHVRNIVELYTSKIKEYFNVEDDKIIAYVFERDSPYQSKKIIKDGLHIMYPHIVSVPEYQYIIREKILKLIPNVLKDISPYIKNSWSDIVDRSVIKTNGWFMYGASKPKLDTYKLKYIFDAELNELDIDPKENYVSLFSIRNKHTLSEINEEKIEEIDNYNKRRQHYKIMRRKKTKKYIDFDLVKDYVSCLSKKRAEDERTWKEVGWCLYNLDNCDKMLELWKLFSEKADNYDPLSCKKYWTSEYASKYSGITLGSLKYWAKNDNEKLFEEIKKTNFNQIIDNSTDNTNNSVAKVLKFLYSDYYKCVVYEKKILWYEFKNHKWISSNQGLSLQKKISNELLDIYCKRISYFNDLITNEENEETRTDLIDKQEALCNLTSKKLKETMFKKNVMTECKEEFNDSEFDDKLNGNLFLIGLENGVYDLKNMEFREGRPDDYISISTSASYIEYDEEDETIQEVYDFFNKIFVNDELRHYVLKLLASCLDGYHHDDIFVILTGTGSNGKSMLLDLINKTFGKMVTKWPIALLTQKRQKGESASPQLISARYSRFVYMDEPDAGTDYKLNSGMIKEYTGGDFISARNMYDSNIIKFQPQFTLFLLCNDIPQVPGVDKAIWRRNRVIPCKSKFVVDPDHNPDPTHPVELQFKKDPTLKNKMNDWVDAFMSILIHYYAIFKKEGFNEKCSDGTTKLPDLIQEAINEYSNECDIYSEFIKKYIINDKTNTERINTVYDKFKDWFSENYDGEKTPNKKEFKKYIKVKYGSKNLTFKNIIGVKLIHDDDDDEY